MPTQPIEIPFGGGINEDLDPKVMQPPYLQLLENGEFSKLGRVNRRGGHSAITHQDISGATPGPAVRLGAYKDSALLCTKDAIYRYASANKWAKADNASSVQVSRQSVARDLTRTLSAPDVAYASGYYLFVWADVLAVCKYNILDATTGAWLLSTDGTVEDLGTTAGFYVHPVAVGSVFFVSYIRNDAGTYKVVTAKIDPTAPSTVTKTILHTDAATANVVFDAAPFTSTSFLLAYKTNTANIRVDIVSNAPAVTANHLVPVVAVALTGLAVIGTTGENVYVAYANVTPDVRCAVLPTSLASHAITIVAAPANQVFQVALSRASATSANIFWQEDVVAGSRFIVNRQSITNAGALGTLFRLYPFGLQSKPWVYDGDTYVCLGYESTLQGTAYIAKLVDTDTGGFRIVASLYPRECGDSTGPATLGAVVAGPNAGQFMMAIQVKTLLATTTTVSSLVSTRGVDALTFDFGGAIATDRRYSHAVSSEHVWLAGGIPSFFDGRGMVEAAFLYSPDSDEITAGSIVGGGALAAGTYLAVFLYEAQDASGNVMRSIVSAPKSKTVGLNDQLVWTVPHLSHFGRTWTSVVCTYFRALVNTSGPYLRVSSTACDITGGVPTTPITFTDGTVDATIAVNASVYTDGGVLDNVPPPPASTVAIAGDRVFLLSGRDVWYSKQFVQGEVPGFSVTMVLRIEDGGDGTAIAALDDKIIVFKESKIFVLDGYGFGDRGDGQNFIARPIASDVGCIESRSVVVSPEGIYFQGLGGLYLLTRNLSVEFVGVAIVDELETRPILTSGVLIASRNQILWTAMSATPNSNGQLESRTLVYDYLRKQWAVWTVDVDIGDEGGYIKSATSLDGTYYYSIERDDGGGPDPQAGTVRKSASGVWADGGTQDYQFRLRTAWIRLANMQGYQQVKRVTLLADSLGTHCLNVVVYADYGTTVAKESYAWDATELAALAREQLSIHIRNQKCEAMMFEISDATGTGAPSFGAGPAISSLLLEVEMKRGSARHLLAQGARK